ncbi:class I SAM-dependent methyltransferase [Streptomyces sp. V1I1]|uniref:class I SAM-dependent methyltransferase n=1 Tax=Streptomyces sp. V1I1 TaxID=3042272 RepID=UPI0027D90BAC|nr:class I SAM-dependent methyltransferase [Streptomyces sp. V1I1]
MPSLLRNRLAKWVLSPADTMIERRIEQHVKHATQALQTDLDALHRKVAALQNPQYGLGLLVDGTGRSGHRTPTAAQIDTLARQIQGVANGSEHALRNVTVAYRTVIALESLGVGRLAGSTSNVCGKLATVPLLSPPNGNVLEIGTLYGMFAAGLLRMLHRSGLEPHLTIVDPLAGAQLQPGAAPQGADPTGTPVREDVVRANLALGGVGSVIDARIQQGFSGDPEVRAAVSDREYGVIVVDGDHSLDGVRADLEWAEQIVAPGGIVVLDDYGDKAWPGVQDALDKHLASGTSRLSLLGRVSTSAYLRAN